MDDRSISHHQPVLSRCGALTTFDYKYAPSDNELLSLQQEPYRTGGDQKKIGIEENTASADMTIRYSALVPESQPERSKLQELIYLQELAGYWKWTEDLLQKIGLDAKRTQRDLEMQYKSIDGDSISIWTRRHLTYILATILVGHYLEKVLGESRDIWELVKEKADIWVQDTTKILAESQQMLLKQLIDGILARAWT